MKTLTIFHDPGCGLCMRFRRWLEAEPKRVAVEFLPHDSDDAHRLFPGLAEIGADREVVVLADDGRWWQGTGAWLTCLWATARYRDWSFRLASPALQPFVGKAVHLLSENRLGISRLMSLRADTRLAAALRALPAGACAGNTCPL